MKKILIIGAVTVDYVSKVKVLPKGNEEIKMDDMFARISGFGWNTANLLRILKVPFDLFALVGQGQNADEIRKVANTLEIPLTHNTDDINGCTYTIVDSNGKTTGMVIPGCEYTFPYYDAEDIYFDDYDAILISDLEMPNEYLDEALQLLESFKGEIYYATSTHGMITNDELKNVLFSYNPILILKPSEVLELSNEKDVVDGARLLSMKTSKQVVVNQKDQPFTVTSETISGIEETEEVDLMDESGTEDTFAAAYMTCKVTGLTEDKSIKFAKFCADLTASSYETIPPQDSISKIQEMFTNSILK